MKAYRVVYERDRRGVWLVSVPAVAGCHSYGRSLDEARRNIREALGLFVPNADAAPLDEQIRIPARFMRAVQRALRARRRAEMEQSSARAVLRTTARSLTQDARLSLRDAGELLGLSRQRVQQIGVVWRRSTRRAR